MPLLAAQTRRAVCCRIKKKRLNAADDCFRLSRRLDFKLHRIVPTVEPYDGCFASAKPTVTLNGTLAAKSSIGQLPTRRTAEALLQAAREPSRYAARNKPVETANR